MCRVGQIKVARRMQCCQRRLFLYFFRANIYFLLNNFYVSFLLHEVQKIFVSQKSGVECNLKIVATGNPGM